MLSLWTDCQPSELDAVAASYIGNARILVMKALKMLKICEHEPDGEKLMFSFFVLVFRAANL